MWILLFIASQYSLAGNDAKLAPTVVMQEFATRERCETARRFIVASFGDDPDKITDSSQRDFMAGYSHSPQRVILKARCVRK